MATHLVCLNHRPCLIWPLYIRRGASAEKYELIALRKILRWLRSRHGERVKRLKISQCIFPSLDLKRSYPEAIRKAYGYVGREVMLAYMAIFYAINLSGGQTDGFAVVAGGLHDDLFAHNSPTFWDQFNELIGIELGSHSIKLFNPLQSGYSISPANKTEVIKFAKDQGFPIRIARSCIADTVLPCGSCLECIQRNLAEAGAK